MVVLTQLPLQSLLQKVDYMGRIAEWGTILRAFDIKYMLRTFIKWQVLADLVVEFTESLVETEDKEQNLGGKQVKAVSLTGLSS